MSKELDKLLKESSSVLDVLYKFQENKNYTREDLLDLADYIEEHIGAAECWKSLKSAFNPIELMENLIYLVTEHDL